VSCTLALCDLRDLTAAVARVRRLLDLDADPVAVGDVLTADRALRAAVRRRPGRRVPGAVDGGELAVRTVLGQQVSVAAARRLAARLAESFGKPLAAPVGDLTHCFPAADALAAADPAELPMPRTRARALVALAGALASGALTLDPGADRDAAAAALGQVDGIGPWTVSYVAMRALGDPDAFLPGDRGVQRGAATLGISARELAAHAARWRPWRAYAVQYLWAASAPLETAARKGRSVSSRRSQP
jgi:AraC family transcriptional regulator of adaptative response / DNA-3-methyladenine glycosylase II